MDNPLWFRNRVKNFDCHLPKKRCHLVYCTISSLENSIKALETQNYSSNWIKPNENDLPTLSSLKSVKGNAVVYKPATLRLFLRQIEIWHQNQLHPVSDLTNSVVFNQDRCIACTDVAHWSFRVVISTKDYMRKSRWLIHSQPSQMSSVFKASHAEG